MQHQSPTRLRCFLLRAWADIKAQRGRYPWLILIGFTLLLAFQLLPRNMMPWPRWIFLVSTVAMVLCCVDFNMMLWRVYRLRKDLKPVRLAVGLISMFLTLLTVGRLLGFASFFFEALLTIASIINLLSGAVALGLVMMARSVEDYAVGLPAISDLDEANQELKDARSQLAFREQNALEGMCVLAGDVIVEANPEAYRIFGYNKAKQELVGMQAHQLLHQDDLVRGYQFINSSESDTYTVRVICKSGRIKYVESTGRNIVRQGAVLRISNFRDVTLKVKYQSVVTEQLRLNPNTTVAAMKTLAEMQSWFATSAMDDAESLRQITNGK